MNVEFRSMVHFCYLLQKGPDKIHFLMVQAYGSQCPSLSFLKKCYTKFKDGRTELNDLQEPRKSLCDEYIDQVSSYLEDYLFSSARNILLKRMQNGYSIILQLINFFKEWMIQKDYLNSP